MYDKAVVILIHTSPLNGPINPTLQYGPSVYIASARIDCCNKTLNRRFGCDEEDDVMTKNELSVLVVEIKYQTMRVKHIHVVPKRTNFENLGKRTRVGAQPPSVVAARWDPHVHAVQRCH